MFCVFSARSIATSLLLGSLLILASCDDETENASQHDTVEIDETSVEVSDNNLETDECLNPDAITKDKCCDDFDIDDQLIKCVLLHQRKMPKEDEKDPKVMVKFLSCLVECTYKGKKYIGKDESLNMNVIKADAKKKHKNDPKMQEYTIEMYAHCERHAAVEWGKIKNNPAAKIILSGACKPYFMFVFMCGVEYGVKVKCPYFAWKGEKNSKKDTVVECNELKSKCEKSHN